MGISDEDTLSMEGEMDVDLDIGLPDDSGTDGQASVKSKKGGKSPSVFSVDAQSSSRGSGSQAAVGRGAGIPTKVIAGKKLCNTCLKQKPLHELGLGKSSCLAPCQRALDNLRNAAQKQGQTEWLKDQVNTLEGTMRLVNAYQRKCGLQGSPGKPGKKPVTFDTLAYKQEFAMQQQMLRDGVYEMMHVVAFSEHAKKPKHFPPRGLDTKSAELEWERLSKLTGAFVDFLGPCDQFRMRVGIMTKTLITFRDADIRSQGYVIGGKEKKNAGQSDVDQMHKRMYEIWTRCALHRDDVPCRSHEDHGSQQLSEWRCL